jgi:hypothetical protein
VQLAPSLREGLLHQSSALCASLSYRHNSITMWSVVEGHSCRAKPRDLETGHVDVFACSRVCWIACQAPASVLTGRLTKS